MIAREVINKLSLEMAFKTGHIEDMKTYKEYLQMAITIGTDHFTRNMEEIVAMTRDGIERGRFRGINEAAKKLGLSQGGISNVIAGRRATCGGFKFILAKDIELIKRPKEDFASIEDSTDKTVMEFQNIIR